MSTTASTPGKSKTNKPKSPPVPSRTLKDCVEDTAKLYKQYSHAEFNRSEIGTTLGVSSSSGPFAARLFTLSEYGLIAKSGAGGYKVSELFLKFQSNASGTAEFKRAAMTAISKSPVFRELLTEFKTKLPPQTALAQRLETQKKFNAERAKEAANVLERSLQFAGVLDGNNNILPVREEQPGQKQDPDPEVTPPVPPSAATNARRTEIPLGDTRMALVQYPHDLSKAEAEKIGRVLVALVA